MIGWSPSRCSPHPSPRRWPASAFSGRSRCSRDYSTRALFRSTIPVKQTGCCTTSCRSFVARSLRERLSKIRRLPRATRSRLHVRSPARFRTCTPTTFCFAISNRKAFSSTTEGALLSDFGFARVVMHAGEDRIDEGGSDARHAGLHEPGAGGSECERSIRAATSTRLGCVLYENVDWSRAVRWPLHARCIGEAPGGGGAFAPSLRQPFQTRWHAPYRKRLRNHRPIASAAPICSPRH